MIIVRDVFRLRFCEARGALAAPREGRPAADESGYRVDRLLVDLTGDYYTLVMQGTFDDLAAFESAYAAVGRNERWQEAYRRFVPHVQSGRREIFRIVE